MERRAHTRNPESLSVEISWQERAAHLKQVGTVVNASRGGLGLLVKLAVPVGSLVSISFGKETLVGMVEHDSVTVGGHIIGIELDSGVVPFSEKSPSKLIGKR